MSLKQPFKSIKHEFQFPAVVFVGQNQTLSKYFCASPYFQETAHLKDSISGHFSIYFLVQSMPHIQEPVSECSGE